MHIIFFPCDLIGALFVKGAIDSYVKPCTVEKFLILYYPIYTYCINPIGTYCKKFRGSIPSSQVDEKNLINIILFDDITLILG